MRKLALIALVVAASASSAQTDKATLQRAAKVEEARLAEAPDDTEALYRLGLAYLSLGQPKKAQQNYADAKREYELCATLQANHPDAAKSAQRMERLVATTPVP